MKKFILFFFAIASSCVSVAMENYSGNIRKYETDDYISYSLIYSRGDIWGDISAKMSKKDLVYEVSESECLPNGWINPVLVYEDHKKIYESLARLYQEQQQEKRK